MRDHWRILIKFGSSSEIITATDWREEKKQLKIMLKMIRIKREENIVTAATDDNDKEEGIVVKLVMVSNKIFTINICCCVCEAPSQQHVV